MKFPGDVTDEISNDPLYPSSQIKTEDIYTDDSLRDMLYPGDPMFFPKPSTDDRKDFELNVIGDDLIIFKSPALTTVSIAKNDLKDSLDKIIEHLDLNLKQTLMSKDDRTETKQKINILKNLNKKFNLIKKTDIEKQLQSHEWLTKLIEDQLKLNKTYHTFGENFESNKLKNKFKNVTIRKRKLLPLTSADRLKDLLSIYTQIPVDWAKKIEAAKNVFSNIIKQILPESYKKFKIDYDQSNNIDISEVKYESDDDISF